MPASGAERPAFSEFEHRAAVTRTGIERLDGVADRADGREQAPEGAEQAEEDQQAGEVAQDVAAFVEAGGDRIEHGAHGGGRERHARGTRQHRLHRRKQHRFGDLGAGAEGVDPAHLAEQPHRLLERQEDADHENAEDQAVEAGIAGEGGGNLTGEDGGDEGDDGEEHQHRQDEDLRAGQPVRVVLHHVRRADQSKRPQDSHSSPDSVPGNQTDCDSKRNYDEIGRRFAVLRRPSAGQSRATTRQSITAAQCSPAATTTKPCQSAFWKRSPFQAKTITPLE